MSSRRQASDVSSASSERCVSDDSNANMEDEMVNVSLYKEQLMAEMRVSIEAELKEMRRELTAMRNECDKMRAERDFAVKMAQEMRAMIEKDAYKSSAVESARTPPRKVAKTSTNASVGVFSNEQFPALPSKQHHATGGSIKANVNLSAPSTSKAAASLPNERNVSNNAGKVTAKYKKILQAIDTDVFIVRRVLNAASISHYYLKQSSRKSPVQIVITEIRDVMAAKKALAAAKISFHEFKTPDERMKCFIIRGLVGATEAEVPFIKEELQLLGLPSDILVSLHLTGFMKANPGGETSAPVKLITPANFDDKLLNHINFLNNTAIRFERFKNKNVMQCKNCQRFGHSASGCQHVHRCVKCGENHYRDTCPRTLDFSAKLKCCNCGGDHTANNLYNCPYFMERYGEKYATAVVAPPASTQRASNNRMRASSTVQPGVSFARAASSNSRPPTANNSARAHVNARKNSSSNFNNTGIYNNNNVDSEFIPIKTTALLTDQLSKILAKLDEHAQMWSKHDKCINMLMSRFVGTHNNE